MVDVNGIEIELTDLDNNDSILKKYALKKGESSFFYIFPPKELKNGASYTAIDIRDEITAIDIFNKKERAKLLAKYPKYTERDLFVAYFYGKSIPSFSTIRKKIKPVFSSEGDLNMALKYLFEEKTQEEEYIEKFKKLIKKFEKIKKADNVVVATASEKGNVVYAYHLDAPVGILRNFNEIRVFDQLPYCTAFTSDKKSFFKVYTEVEKFWDEWLEDAPENDEKIKCYIVSKPKKWVSLEWNIHNNLRLTIPSGHGSEQKIRETIISALPGEYEVPLPTPFSVGILFNIDTVINKNVLSFAIGTDQYLREFLFFNEFSIPALSKVGEKLGMYLGFANNYNTKTSVSIVLVPDTDKGGMLVRINGCNNSDHSSRVKNIFLKLLNYYEGVAKANAEAVLRDYGLSTEKKARKTKKAKVAPAKAKPEKKLKILKRQRPEMFGVDGYARHMCQGENSQTTLIEGADPDDVANELYNGDDDRVMEYPLESGDVYICDNPVNKYPGLKVNTLDNNDEYEYLPCCYPEPQKVYNRPLGKYLIENEIMEGELPTETKSEDVYHVLASTKLAPPGRLSRLPIDIYTAFKKIGLEDVVFDRVKKPTFSLLRYGVNKSRDSALYCLETAFNQEFVLFDEYQQFQHIRELKTKLKIPEEYGSFFNPVDFIDKLMNHYGANIYMFKADSSSPRGEIVIPGKMYLPKRLPMRNTVLLMMNEIKAPWKHQYEIIIKVNQYREGKYVYNSSFYPEIVQQCEKLLEETYRVYYTK